MARAFLRIIVNFLWIDALFISCFDEIIFRLLLEAFQGVYDVWLVAGGLQRLNQVADAVEKVQVGFLVAFIFRINITSFFL